MAKWLQGLWEFIENKFPVEVHKVSLRGHAWLKLISQAACDFLSEEKDESEESHFLVKFGHCRAKDFLFNPRKMARAPFFGLCNPATISALSQKDDAECAIIYLREMMKANFNGAYIIQCERYVEAYPAFKYFEYATVFPRRRLSKKRDHQRSQILEEGHARWFRYPADSRQNHFQAMTRTRMADLERGGEACFFTSQNKYYSKNNCELLLWQHDADYL